ncbi:Integral membrane protein OS=Streptomyces alboniger OX=132473 GN=CP975_22085 PE=4 SV=1 [Streptomyces alboniger]
MARRPVALLGAIVLLVEAVGIALLNWFLGMVVDKQEMSLAGLDPHAMTVSTWIAGIVFGGYLALCAFVLARAAVRDRAPGRLGRVLLITCAVVHGVLGAFCVGPVGWPAFAFMMVVLGLVVLPLVAYDRAGRVTPTTA